MRFLSKKIVMRTALGAALVALMSSTALAADLSIWVRSSGANAATHMIDLWNATHDKQIELTVIPDNQMVTKLATGVQAGDVPDLVSFDLIYMPDFMRAGFLTDITDEMNADPNYAMVADAYKNIAAYEDRIYGTGFTPDVSILVWNKGLFKAAGLDPEVPPQTLGEIHEMAKKVSALGEDTYGFYFSGACPGCNIFVTSPMMVASGAKMLPMTGDDDALTDPGVTEVLQLYRDMWTEGLVPQSAQADAGTDFVAMFESGKIGIQGAGGFLISDIKANYPDLDFGVTYLPGMEKGQKSSFVGGDVIAIPKGSRNVDLALEFIHWEMSDEAQLEGLAKNAILPSRTDLADNDYFKSEPRVVTTAKALAVGYVPWVFHFNDMVNSDSSPWINMLQSAIFDGNIKGAIVEARDQMKQIASE